LKRCTTIGMSPASECFHTSKELLKPLRLSTIHGCEVGFHTSKELLKLSDIKMLEIVVDSFPYL